MKLTFEKVLVLAPHTDDAEFGCGGTIAKLVAEGSEVHIAAFSACEQSVRPEFPKDILISEIKNATRILGVKPENLHLFKYPVRTFNFSRQEILQDLIDLREEIKPELIFMPSLDDIHQDHNTIAREGLRAFKFSSILCYEMPWNNVSFKTNGFIQLQPEYVNKKVEALKEYESQAHRPYASEEFIRALTKVRGTQINVENAESFEVLRWMIK